MEPRIASLTRNELTPPKYPLLYHAASAQADSAGKSKTIFSGDYSCQPFFLSLAST